MSNKLATVGIKDFHFAIATEVEGVVTYGTPKPIRDIQRISIQPSTSTDKYYADDNTADILDSFDGATVSADFYGVAYKLISEISGSKVDTNGVIVEKGLDEAPYIAVGFRSLKRNKKYRYVWLVYGKKTTHTEEMETIKEKQDPKSMTLPFEFIVSPETNIWKYTVDEEDLDAEVTGIETKWFAKVYDGSFGA